MDKPKVFLSHSSRDAAALNFLRTTLIEKTGGSIDFFLSSDGQSIPFGRNWVHEIEQALKSSKIMFVFLSPLSAQSNWIHFESGFAYAQGVRVVPVGCSGLDLTSIHPPLNLLQGFNLNNEAGMNNILAVLNDALGHRHDESFTAIEFKSLMDYFTDGNVTQIPELLASIESVESEIESDSEFDLPDMSYAFTQKGLGYYADDTVLAGLGIVLRQERHTRHPGPEHTPKIFIKLKVSAGYESLPKNLPVLFELARRLERESAPEISLTIKFTNDIFIQDEFYLVTDKLVDSDVVLKDDTWASFRGLTFCAGTHRTYRAKTSSSYYDNSFIKISGNENDLNIDNIGRLIALFFERNIMQERERI